MIPEPDDRDRLLALYAEVKLWNCKDREFDSEKLQFLNDQMQDVPEFLLNIIKQYAKENLPPAGHPQP
jgi:hypothetical protein